VDSLAGYPGLLRLEGDPARDDFSYNFNIPPISQNKDSRQFDLFNGLEGNSGAQTSALSDTEVLNRNNGQTIMQDNSFFRYKVDIQNISLSNPQIANITPAGWVTFRIPVRSDRFRTSVGNPLLSNIQYVRVWWKGGRFKGRIESWAAVGSQWQRFRPVAADGQPDTTTTINFVSLENNAGGPDFYSSPPGLRRAIQLGNPDPNLDVQQNEQSLAFTVRNLAPRQERMTIRYFRPMDWFFYKQLKFFIHGDGSVPANQTVSDAEAVGFIRFGVDSSNYYEYSFPLKQGWQDLGIPLASLTAVKVLGRDTTRLAPDGSGMYRVVGTPTLTRVQFVGFGVRNNSTRDLSTTIWTNELRVIEPDTGNFLDRVAAVGSLTAKLADLGTVSASYQRTGGNFHRLEERFGNRNFREALNVNAQADLVKLIPGSQLFLQGTSIPISYIYTNTFENSQLVPQSDLRVAETESIFLEQDFALPGDLRTARAEKIVRRAGTRVIENQFAITGAKFNATSGASWLMANILSRLVLSFDIAQRIESSSLIQSRQRLVWNTKLGYSKAFDQFSVQPFGWAENVPLLAGLRDWRIFLNPSSVSFGVDLRRDRQTETLWNTTDPSSLEGIVIPEVLSFTSTQNLKFTWRTEENGLLNPTIDYTLANLTTLLPLALDPNFRQRPAGEFFSSLWLQNGRVVDLGSDVRTEQTLNVTMKPRLPDVLGGKFLDLGANYSASYSWQNILNPLPDQEDYGKSARVEGALRITGALRWRDIGTAIFGAAGGNKNAGGGAGSGSGPNFGSNPFATPDNPNGGQDGQRPADSTAQPAWLGVLRGIIFDFDRINITYNIINSSTNVGLQGGNGVTNFWTRATLFRPELASFGPLAGYQLGFLENPNGSLRFVPSNEFPFFTTRQDLGRESYGVRARNALLPPDNFKRASTLDITTNRPLWEGAQLSLNWQSRWDENRNQSLQTDADGFVADSAGILRIRNRVVARTYNRTIVSIPALFDFLNPTFNSAEQVITLYRARADAELRAPLLPNGTTGSVQDSARARLNRNARLLGILSESFQDGMEALGTLSILPRSLRNILPSFNWALRWSSIERTFPVLSKYVRTASLEHRYVATQQSGERELDGVGRVNDNEQIDVNFQPLIGINAQLNDDVLDGALSGSLRYSTKSGYRINAADRAAIARETTNDFTMNATYTKRNVKLTLAGMDFENDVEFAFQASYKRTLQSVINIPGFESVRPSPNNEVGNRLDGRTSLVIEPSARYVLSSKLAVRAFFRYELNLNEGAASPGNSTTQLGLDVRLTLSGGR
jgi:hypothetical protein